MEPLTALRQFIRSRKNGNPVHGDIIVLGDSQFQKDEQTAFRKYQTDNDYYTLMEMLFFSMHWHLTPAEYVQETIAQHVNRVHYLDQQEMKKYLMGELNHCDKIDQNKTRSHHTRPAPTSAAVAAPAPAPLSEDKLTHYRRQYAQSMDEYKQQILFPSSEISLPELTLDAPYMEADLKSLEPLRAREVVIVNRNSILHKEAANLADETLRWYEESVKKANTLTDTAAPNRPAANTSANKRHRESKTEERVIKKRPKGVPIIIVPNGVSGVLSSINAKDLLQDATYATIAEKRTQNTKREPRFEMKREVNGQSLRYEVVDDVRRLRDAEWERVVAVFANGEQWQFRGWKWSEPVELFQHVLGLHMMFEGEPIKPNISSWNVRVVKVSKIKRHLDSIAFNDIWRAIDEWMNANCPWLLQQAMESAQPHQHHHSHHQQQQAQPQQQRT